MNWVDLVVLGVILLSGVLALARGFVREALGLGAWIAAAAIAWVVTPMLEPLARPHFNDPTIAYAVPFAVTFLVVLVVLLLLCAAIANFVQGSVLGGLDHMLGLLFGLARGAALVCAAYIVVGIVFPIDQWPAVVLEARALPMVYRCADWLVTHEPEGITRPLVAPPPAPRTTTATPTVPASQPGRTQATPSSQ